MDVGLRVFIAYPDRRYDAVKTAVANRHAGFIPRASETWERL